MSQTPASPLLEISHLTLKYAERLILNDISFQVLPNEIVTLVGPNGAGKSSLLRAILGLVPVASGGVHIKPGLRMGYMPQKLAIDPSMPLSVERFLKLTYPKPVLTEPHALELIQTLRLQPLLTSKIHDLSGGEWQRVLLARALIKRPELLVLDEPAQNADVNGQAEFYQHIQVIRHQRQCAVLMVSHDLHMVMAGTDRVICLNQHICCSGTPQEVTQDPHFLAACQAQTPVGLAIYTHHHTHRHD